MTRRTGRASRIEIKGPRSGSTEAPMRRPRRHGRRFAAERRVVGKSSRVAEQTGSGKRVRETALVPEAAKAAVQTAVGRAATQVGKRVRERLVPEAAKAAVQTAVGGAATQVGWGTGQRSAVAAAPRLVASGAPGEADRQMRSRDLGGVARCVTRARVAPRTGAEKGEPQAAGASSVLVAAPMAVAAGASSVGAAAVPVVVAGASMVGAADIGEAGVVGRMRVRGSFSPCPHQDGGCTSNASTMSDERHTGPVSDSRHRSP